MMVSRSIGWRSAYSIVRATRFAVAALVFFSIAARSTSVFAQAGFEDDRVMLQGFYWESSRHGYRDKFPQFGSEHWYAIIAREAPAIRAARFDLVWLPPPSFAGGEACSAVAILASATATGAACKGPSFWP